MAKIYEKDLPSLQEYLQHFSLIGYQVGAVFTINGEVVGMDAFGRPETFSKVFTKLVQSYALDAIDWIDGNKGDELSRDDVTDFKKGIFSCKMETHDSVGLGTDCRLESDKLTGFALALDGKVLHMSVFARLAGCSGKITDFTDGEVFAKKPESHALTDRRRIHINYSIEKSSKEERRVETMNNSLS